MLIIDQVIQLIEEVGQAPTNGDFRVSEVVQFLRNCGLVSSIAPTELQIGKTVDLLVPLPILASALGSTGDEGFVNATDLLLALTQVLTGERVPPHDDRRVRHGHARAILLTAIEALRAAEEQESIPYDVLRVGSFDIGLELRYYFDAAVQPYRIYRNDDEIASYVTYDEADLAFAGLNTPD
jgi:hypothetical protein